MDLKYLITLFSGFSLSLIILLMVSVISLGLMNDEFMILSPKEVMGIFSSDYVSIGYGFIYVRLFLISYCFIPFVNDNTIRCDEIRTNFVL